MKDPYLYFDVDKQERDSAIRFLLGAILRSRQDTGIDVQIEEFDEDVNIYLAHLLFAVTLPEYRELAEPYLSSDSSDVLRWIRSTEDRTIRYFIFKVNADHLLVHLAIFDDLSAQSYRGILRRSEKHFAELGRLYYEQASNYHTRIYRRKTGVGDVLQKLGRHFNLYWQILRMVRKDYLHFVTRFRDQAFERFIIDVNRYESESYRQSQTDHFLDLYSGWIKTKNPHLESELRRILGEIRQFDPEFGKGTLGDLERPL